MLRRELGYLPRNVKIPGQLETGQQWLRWMEWYNITHDTFLLPYLISFLFQKINI